MISRPGLLLVKLFLLILYLDIKFKFFYRLFVTAEKPWLNNLNCADVTSQSEIICIWVDGKVFS